MHTKKARTEREATMMRGPIARYSKETGKRVTESLVPLTLIVEKKDTNGAKRLSPSSCGFAKACIRQVDGVESVHFYRSTAYLEYTDRLVKYALTPAMRQEINTFDRTGEIAPGTYYLKPITNGVSLQNM